MQKVEGLRDGHRHLLGVVWADAGHEGATSLLVACSWRAAAVLHCLGLGGTEVQADVRAWEECCLLWMVLPACLCGRAALQEAAKMHGSEDAGTCLHLCHVALGIQYFMRCVEDPVLIMKQVLVCCASCGTWCGACRVLQPVMGILSWHIAGFTEHGARGGRIQRSIPQ